MLDKIKEVNWSPNAQELRSWGRILMIGFPFVALFWTTVVWLRSDVWNWTVFAYIFGIGVGVGLLAQIIPPLTKPVYWLWFALICLIEITVTTVLFTLLYYLVIMPVGKIKLMKGNGHFRKSPDNKIKTYWKDLEQDVDPKRYYRQF